MNEVKLREEVEHARSIGLVGEKKHICPGRDTCTCDDADWEDVAIVLDLLDELLEWKRSVISHYKVFLSCPKCNALKNQGNDIESKILDRIGEAHE